MFEPVLWLEEMGREERESDRVSPFLSLYSLAEFTGKSNKGWRIIDKRKVTKLAFVKINSSPFKRFPQSFPTPHSMCGNFSQQNFVFKTGTASQQRESKAALRS